MDPAGHRKRFLDVDKKSNEELMSLIAELTRECEEKRKSCAKLQGEVQHIQDSLAERNAARSTKLKEYSEALDVLPLAEKANSTKHRLEELEMELKNTKDSKESSHQRRQTLQEEIRLLQTERVRLDGNHNALLENIANVKCQLEATEKTQPQTSRAHTRREADERLDDLVKQYLPHKLFKSRRRDDHQND